MYVQCHDGSVMENLHRTTRRRVFRPFFSIISAQQAVIMFRLTFTPEIFYTEYKKCMGKINGRPGFQTGTSLHFRCEGSSAFYVYVPISLHRWPEKGSSQTIDCILVCAEIMHTSTTRALGPPNDLEQNASCRWNSTETKQSSYDTDKNIKIKIVSIMKICDNNLI